MKIYTTDNKLSQKVIMNINLATVITTDSIAVAVNKNIKK